MKKFFPRLLLMGSALLLTAALSAQLRLPAIIASGMVLQQTKVKIEGNTIIVSNQQLASPTQVRYGFGDTLIGNVFSKEGLPLAPYRSDDWPAPLP